jgi:hypothetical protein
MPQIEEVNRYFDEEQANESTVPDSFSCPDTCLLFKSHPPATKQELLNMLPEREIVDQLVARYFCSNSPALRVSHFGGTKVHYLIDYRHFTSTIFPKRGE